MQRLLVATKNPGKLKEYREMLNELGEIEWLSLWDVGLGEMEVEETGDTFESNARLKSEAYSQASGLITLSDDSGLVVDALNGEPGVYSARYGGLSLTSDRQRYELLLKNLEGVVPEKRTARFECIVAITSPGKETEFSVGRVEGHIGFGPRGENGFGYDPVFQLPDGRMLAELPSEEKNPISHRGLALEAALPILRRLLAE
jgi:XTP/dITP diphosphohydrolase